MKTADVVVIGAGVVGSSCALIMAEAGLKVIVVDRGPIAGGTTGAPAGGGAAKSGSTAPAGGGATAPAAGGGAAKSGSTAPAAGGGSAKSGAPAGGGATAPAAAPAGGGAPKTGSTTGAPK